MAIEFIKVDLTDHLGPPWNISLNEITPYAACLEKEEFNQSSILFTHQTRKIDIFFLRKPSATKHSHPSNVYYMEFYLKIFIENSLFGIVNPFLPEEMIYDAEF